MSSNAFRARQHPSAMNNENPLKSVSEYQLSRFVKIWDGLDIIVPFCLLRICFRNLILVSVKSEGGGAITLTSP